MELYYQIALKGVPFDNSYKNVLRFDTRSEQEAYFKTNTLFSNSPKVNFNVGSLYATNVIYDGIEENINELLNHNYCIIKDNRPNAQLKYYYYFVTNAMQDCDNRIKLSLELDIFQTYYIDLSFGDSIIYKAHLNRFIDNGDGTVSFDGTPTSKLFEREDIKNVAKRMTKRTKVDLYPNTELGNWFNKNVLGWVYMFIDPTHDYTYIKTNDLTQSTKKFQPLVNRTNNGMMPTNLAVMVYPVLKENKEIVLYDPNGSTGSFRWGVRYNVVSPLMEQFAQLNNGYAYVYTTKFSIYPPFKELPNFNYSINSGFTYDYISINVGTIGEHISLDFGGYGLNFSAETYAFRTGTIENGNVYPCMSLMKVAEKEFIPQDYITEKQFKFNKNEIVNANKNVKFNPKLLSSDYFDLRISDSTENGFNYDLQKLNNNILPLLISESITPEFTKRYIRIKESGLYIKETSENLTGFVSSNDNSFAMPTTDYQSMLANNKNFFVQNDINRKIEATKSGISTGVSLIGNIASGNYMGLFGNIAQGVNTGLNYQQSVINQNLTVDNLQNAPANVIQAKGNIIFECQYSINGIIVEEHEILDNEKEMINDYMCLYGFTYNRVDNIKNVDNIRKIYNFIRADIETINGANISETVHQKFRQCFANGVRFWNTDIFSYDKENYERWLENE